MGLQDPKAIARDTGRDLSDQVGEIAALKGDAHHWLTDLEYAGLRYRLEAAQQRQRQRWWRQKAHGAVERRTESR